MSQLMSWHTFNKFARRVQFDARYILDTESREFIETLIATSGDRKTSIKKGVNLWRAQLGNDWTEEHVEGEDGEIIETFDVPTCFSPERMKPRGDKAKEGRINPKGIPCLYLATSKEAAMSEVRPWIGAAISLSQFKVNRDLTVIDLSKHHAQDALYGLRLDEKEMKPEENLDVVWTHVDWAFSNPVQFTEDTAGYAPTQMIAERFKEEGYDGVVYKSPFGDKGFNVALFDIRSADCIYGSLFEAKSIEIEFQETANPYYVTPKRDDAKEEPE